MYSGSSDIYNSIVVGHVVDTNDPQHRGRIRVYCPDFGDLPGNDISGVPWCQYMSPFGGMVSSDKMTRGPGDHSTKGSVAYGMWALPKVGAQGLVMCINGDPSRRVFVGCLPPMHSEHTMPHGRYIDGDGPFSSEEAPIEPLYSNLKKAFGDKTSSEYQSRAADCGVTGLNQDHIDNNLTGSKKKDSTSGYKQSRLTPDKKSDLTGTVFDNQVYSLTTPGFHSISMDDSKDNGRIRIRTGCGHNILLDDTNERIYINSAEGNNWIEIDQDGTIDIYASQSISIKSDTDINLTADKSIRMHAPDIHICADQNIRVTATNELTQDAKNITQIAAENYATSSKTTSLNAANAFEVNSKITTIGGNKLGLAGSKIIASTPIKLGGVSISSKAPKRMAEKLKKLEPLEKADVIQSMPGEALADTLGTMEPTELNEILGSVDPDILGDIANKLPMDSLNEIMPELDGDLMGGMLDGMELGKLSEMVDQMPGDMMGGMMNKLDPGMLDGVLDKSNILSCVPTDICSDLLNKLPMDNILPKLQDMPLDSIMNLPDIGLKNLAINMPDINSFMNILPIDMKGGVFSVLNPDTITNIITNTPINQLPNLLKNAPNIAENMVSRDVHQILRNVPGYNTAKIIGIIPNEYQSIFNMEMKMPDLGEVLKKLPGPVIDEMMAKLPREDVNLIFGGLSGRVINNLLLNMDNPKRILDTLKTDTINHIFRDMPGGDLLSGMANGKYDLKDLTQRLGNQSINDIIGSVGGVNMLPMMNNLVDMTKGIQDKLSSIFDTNGISSILPDMPSFSDISNMLPDISNMIPDIDNIIPDLDLSNLGCFDSMGNIGDLVNSMDMAQLSNLTDLMPTGDLNAMMDMMDPGQLTDMLSNIIPEDFDKLMDKMPNELMENQLEKLDEEQLGKVIDNMPSNALMATSDTKPEKPDGVPRAFFPTRIPMHEPWIRSNNTDDYDKTPKYKEGDTNIGKDNKTRNDFWKR